MGLDFSFFLFLMQTKNRQLHLRKRRETKLAFTPEIKEANFVTEKGYMYFFHDLPRKKERKRRYEKNGKVSLFLIILRYIQFFSDFERFLFEIECHHLSPIFGEEGALIIFEADSTETDRPTKLSNQFPFSSS